MEKTDVVAALGQQKLLLPAWIKAALAANDRLKFALTALQAAAPMSGTVPGRRSTCAATTPPRASTRRGC